MSFDSPAKHLRVERHLMRQRGAGVRTVSSNFGFSIGLNSVPTSSDTTPAASEPPSKRRKTNVEHNILSSDEAKQTVAHVVKPRRARKRLVLEEEEVARGSGDDSFVFGQSKKRKSGHMESTGNAISINRQTELEPKEIQEGTTAKSTRAVKRSVIGSAAIENSTAIDDVPANLTGRRQRSQRNQATTKTSSKSVIQKSHPHGPPGPIGEDDSAVAQKSKARKIRQKHHSKGEADDTNVLLPLHDQEASTSRPAVRQTSSRGNRKSLLHEQRAADLDHSDQGLEPEGLPGRSNAVRVRSVTPVPDRETRSLTAARQTRRAKAVHPREAMDVTDVIQVSTSDIFDERSVASLICLKQQEQHRGLSRRCIGAAPTCRSELDSAIAADGQRATSNPLGYLDSAESTANGAASRPEYGDSRMTKPLPLAEIDTNRFVSPNKPNPKPRTRFRSARAQQKLSNSVVDGSKFSSPDHANTPHILQQQDERQRTERLSRQGADPTKSKAPYRDYRQSIAKVQTTTAAKIDAADAQIYAQNSALTRIVDPACRSERQRYGRKNDHRSLNCGPHSATVVSEPDDSNTCAKTSSLLSTSFEHPSGMPAQRTDARASRKCCGRKDKAVVLHVMDDDAEDVEEDVDWLAEPAAHTRQQRNNAGLLVSVKGEERLENRTQMLDIDLDDLISNIATFAKDSGLQSRATARPGSKIFSKA